MVKMVDNDDNALNCNDDEIRSMMKFMVMMMWSRTKIVGFEWNDNAINQKLKIKTIKTFKVWVFEWNDDAKNQRLKIENQNN